MSFRDIPVTAMLKVAVRLQSSLASTVVRVQYTLIHDYSIHSIAILHFPAFGLNRPVMQAL